ncbi:group-specific protein [Domibacillus antri]|uniref:Group-specific protein n=1 Tax=Domibacillus antri TaxID=1714264 RepID=A0A1Q8Q260_9BACI|nr:group-specific protein [Domibacillus antri]OLN21429.1 group-specific protein [Domibacillus antri]
MLSVQIDEAVVEKQFREEVQKRMEQLDRSRLLWDMKELCRQTSMSESFIKEQFFYDKRFPKVKVGRKWVIPAKAAEEFIIQWLSEQ